MKEMSKQLDKDLSKIFFNSVEEMNERYGIDAKLPRGFNSNADLVCYEIVRPFVFKYMGQYVLLAGGFYHLNNLGKPVVTGCNEIKSESDVHASDGFSYEGRCFVYVRVNEYLRKNLEKTLIGCEFVYRNNKTEIPYRRFVHSVEARKSGIIVTDQGGLSGYLGEQLFYPDDYSDPIHYKDWVKQINEQGVEG